MIKNKASVVHSLTNLQERKTYIENDFKNYKMSRLFLLGLQSRLLENKKETLIHRLEGKCSRMMSWRDPIVMLQSKLYTSTGKS